MRELPDWFEIKESIVEYVDGVRAYYFCAVSKVVFYSLEEIKEIWGEKNPYLILVNY